MAVFDRLWCWWSITISESSHSISLTQRWHAPAVTMIRIFIEACIPDRFCHLILGIVQICVAYRVCKDSTWKSLFSINRRWVRSSSWSWFDLYFLVPSCPSHWQVHLVARNHYHRQVNRNATNWQRIRQIDRSGSLLRDITHRGTMQRGRL